MSTHEERMKKVHDEIDEINRRIEQISSSRTGFSSSYSTLQDLGIKPSYSSSSCESSSSFSRTSGSGGYGSTDTSSDSWRSTLFRSDTRDSLEEEVRRKEAASRAATERWKAIRDANRSATGYSGGSSSSSSTTGLGGGYSSTTSNCRPSSPLGGYTSSSTYRPSSPVAGYFSKDKGTATGASYTSAFGAGAGAGGGTSSSFAASDWKKDTGGYGSTSGFDFSKGTTTTTTSGYGDGISSGTGSGTLKSLYEPTTTTSYTGGSTAAAEYTSTVARTSRPSLPPLIMPPPSPSPSSPIGSHWSPNLPSPD